MFVVRDGIGMGLWSTIVGLEDLKVGLHFAFGGSGMWLGAIQWLGCLTTLREWGHWCIEALGNSWVSVTLLDF